MHYVLLKILEIQILLKDLVHQCGFLVLNTPPLRMYKNQMAVKNLILELQFKML